MKAALWQTENRGNLTPFVAGISFAQKTKVDPIRNLLTECWHKSKNVNGYSHRTMSNATMQGEYGGPGAVKR